MWGGEGREVKGRRDITLLVVGLAVQIALSFHIRLRAWPETLVPAYLVSKGWHLYREIKFAHAPLWIAIESVVAAVFGLSPATLRALALVPAVAAHAGVWYAGKRLGWGMPARWAASLFFVATFYLWDGNAVYPDVAIAALTIPAWLLLREGSSRGIALAGALLGSAVAIKQPACVAVAAAAIGIAFTFPRALGRFLLFAALPYMACAAAYVLAGSGREFLLWTVIVPLRDYGGRTGLLINAAQVPWIILGSLPLAAHILMRAAGARAKASAPPSFLLPLILGFGVMALPKFELVHMIPCVPLLAVAAGLAVEAARRGAGPVRWMTAIPAAVIALDSLFLATDTSAGEISFWNTKEDDLLVRELARRPAAPLYLYGPDQNVFIRSGRLPPGRLYANPGLWYQLRAENLEMKQIEILRAHPETILISFGEVPTGDAGAILAAWVSARSTAMPVGTPRPRLTPVP
jgi:hypothetical protein